MEDPRKTSSPTPSSSYKADSLVVRGLMHELRCEDDCTVIENDRYIGAGVFDGCSSGVDSHVASTTHRRIFERIFQKITGIETATELCINPKYYFDEITLSLSKFFYVVNEEMLSTVLLAVVDKETGEYFVLVCGDGYIRTPDVEESIHDPNGNEVWYLSSTKFRATEMVNYFNRYAHRYKGVLQPGEELVISTDGLESFNKPMGASADTEAVDIFVHPERIGEKYANIPLIRRYRMATNGKMPNLDGEKVRNLDDFSMVIIKREKKDEETD